MVGFIYLDDYPYSWFMILLPLQSKDEQTHFLILTLQLIDVALIIQPTILDDYPGS